MGLFSCVSTKVPKKLKKAQKKMVKHVEGISNIVDEYPELADTLTTTVHDTIYLDSHTVKSEFTPDIDTTAIDEILMDALIIYDEEFAEVRTATPEAGRSSAEEARLRRRAASIRKAIIKEVLKDTNITYEDTIMVAKFSIVDGTYVFDYEVKKRKVPYVKEETKIDLDTEIRKPVWKYWEWWLTFGFLLFFIYLAFRRKKQDIVITNVENHGLQDHPGNRETDSP